MSIKGRNPSGWDVFSPNDLSSHKTRSQGMIHSLKKANRSTMIRSIPPVMLGEASADHRSKPLRHIRDTENPLLGKLAEAEGLAVPIDWIEGWIWTWKGRRTHIRDDILGRKITNFAGHMSLVTPSQQFISMSPIVQDPESEFPLLYDAIMTKDREYLENMHLCPQIVTDDPSPWEAITAGIPVFKTRVLYSPSRIQELLDRSLIDSCKYSWNIDIEKRHINCNTFCQAWHVTKELPWIPKMGRFHQWCREELGNKTFSLSRKDMVLARNVAMAHERRSQTGIAADFLSVAKRSLKLRL